jgi:hypothetical protein
MAGMEFFSFHEMVSMSILKIVYALGMVALTVVGIAMFFTGSNTNLMIGLALIFIGNLVWRIICEGIILLFSIHELLSSINSKIGNENYKQPTPPYKNGQADLEFRQALGIKPSVPSKEV